MVVPDRPDEDFAEQYRKFARRILDQFEFFGADPRGVTRTSRFESGYVDLTLTRQGAEQGGRVSAGLPVSEAVAGAGRSVIRGVAGAGKSTLLRRLGWVAAAPPSEDVEERAPLPFLVELGRRPHGNLPALDRLVPAPLRPMMPAGWMHRMAADGRVLLLLDGLDEVRANRRDGVHEWTEQLLAVHDGTRCVITTRPSGQAEQHWVDRGFACFDLLSMSRSGVERYVEGWHAAAAGGYPSDDPARVQLQGYARTLLTTLRYRPTLQGMSANPLLCGLLCALHLERGEHLPEARSDVYDQALDLLLVRWPILRLRHRRRPDGPALPSGGVAEAELELTAPELYKLLERTAFWMVANDHLVLTRDDALFRVQAAMQGFAHTDRPERVLRYLAVGCGLLRERPDGALEFVHRTFRDHLAARDVVEEANFGLMLHHAERPEWHDVVVLAGARARPAERADLLRRMLQRGGSSPAQGALFALLAAAVLEQGGVLPAPRAGERDVRGEVRAAVSGLLPPRTREDVDLLANAGPFVIGLLPAADAVDRATRGLVVDLLARIAGRWNPPGIVDMLTAYDADSDPTLLTALLGAWGRAGDFERYAREVLHHFDFSGIEVEIHNQRRLDHIEHLDTIERLVVRNSFGNLAPLARLPRLRDLTISTNDMVSLHRLVGCTALRRLTLHNVAQGRGEPLDIGVLRQMPWLRGLEIGGMVNAVELAGLADTSWDEIVLGGRMLWHAEAMVDVTVERLVLRARTTTVPFERLRGVHTVEMNGLPEGDTVRALARARPRVLVLRGVEPGTRPPDLPAGIEVRWG